MTKTRFMRCGSQLSYESLRRDLVTSFETVQRWIGLFEALFYCYRLRPYSKNVKRSLIKEPKIYLYDWSLAATDGARLENMVAGHLLKSCQAWTDCAMGEFELYYVRDKQKREVDFFIMKDRSPFALIEVKSNNRRPTDALLYFRDVLNPRFCIQVVRDKMNEKKTMHGISVLSIGRFLGSLV